MKFPLLLPLLQLLVISIPYISVGAAQLVYDTEGKELSSDFQYCVLPANRDIGGGLIYIPTGLRCLNFVAQEPNKALLGTPVLITPRNTSTGAAIRLSSDVIIEFNDLGSFCAKRLDFHITSKKPGPVPGTHQYVAAGNEDGIRSSRLFRIEKAGANMDGYKLVSCVDNTPCKDLGLPPYKDKTLLSISNKPLMIVFKNANNFVS